MVRAFCAWRLAGCRLLFSFIAFVSLSCSVFAATLFCQISSFAPDEHSFKVSCTVSDLPTTEKVELRFLDRFAGIERLNDRVFGLQIRDSEGQRRLPEILGNGVYRVDPGDTRNLTVDYEMRLARLTGAAADPGRYALTSSLGPQSGFLLLSDILPTVCSAARLDCAPQPVRLKLLLPDAWQVATTEIESSGAFDVADLARAVFLVGRLEQQTIQVGAMSLQVALAGEMNLAMEQILPLVEAIARQQATFIGSREEGKFLVTLAPFPVALTGLRSSALTRGRSVIMLLNPESNDLEAKRTLALYQKHLAHEMFHFYLPESFVARENFDWFWEGFTRYVALLTLNKLRLISLREYLDELGFEFDAYKANSLRDRLSLIAASQGKFSSAASYDLLYHKGTLVAGLYDLELRVQSKGSKTVLDVMRDLYANYRQREVGNQTVLAMLRKTGKFDSFVRDYIEGTKSIDLSDFAKPMGFTVDNASGRVRLNVAKKLSSQQNALLAPLGY